MVQLSLAPKQAVPSGAVITPRCPVHNRSTLLSTSWDTCSRRLSPESLSERCPWPKGAASPKILSIPEGSTYSVWSIWGQKPCPNPFACYIQGNLKSLSNSCALCKIRLVLYGSFMNYLCQSRFPHFLSGVGFKNAPRQTCVHTSIAESSSKEPNLRQQHPRIRVLSHCTILPVTTLSFIELGAMSVLLRGLEVVAFYFRFTLECGQLTFALPSPLHGTSFH